VKNKNKHTPGPWTYREEQILKKPFDPKHPYWPKKTARIFIIESETRACMFLAEVWDHAAFAEVRANCKKIVEASKKF